MKYIAGDSYLVSGNTYRTYRISEGMWAGKIHVFGDEELRDRIVRLLNADDEKRLHERKTRISDEISLHLQKAEELREQLRNLGDE